MANTTTQPTAPPSPIALNAQWALWVDPKSHGNGSWAMDTHVKPTSSAGSSVRVDVRHSAGSGAQGAQAIDLHLDNLDFQQADYVLSFWAKASMAHALLVLNARKGSPPWMGFGLDTKVAVGTDWAQYQLPIMCGYNSTKGRLSFQVGEMPAGSTLWLNDPKITGTVTSLPVWRRDFECGVALLNGDDVSRTVELESGLKRLQGQQAPKWQLIIDDNSSAFNVVHGHWVVGSFDSGYDMARSSSEQVRPPDGFYHHWAAGAHTAAGPAAATFALGVSEPGMYNVSMWWADAVPARSTWSTAMTVTLSSSNWQQTNATRAVAQHVVNLATEGGDVWLSVATNVHLSVGATLKIECPGGSGTCMADAVLIESEARMNDGSPAAKATIAAKDAIILARADAPLHC